MRRQGHHTPDSGEGRGVSRRATPASALRRWAAWVSAAAVCVTTTDAYLLHRKKGFFTGGFLSTDHLDSFGERLVFIVLSLLSDAAFIGLAVAVAIPGLRLLRLSARTTWALAAIFAVAPLAIADVVRFELDRYLGDAFDLTLMFELTGRSPTEFLAVGWAHAIVPVGLLLLGASVVVTLYLRRWRARTGSGADPTATPGWRLPVTVFLAVAVVASTARVASPLLDDALRRKPSVDWVGRLVDVATDVDRDGYGLLSRPTDPAPLDGDVYPYAIDIPGNGIDEDGIGGDMPADAAPYVEVDPGPGRWSSRRHVVLILLESVRADAVGAVWEGRPVTPVMDRLAESGLRSENAWSHNGYTVQSRHHIFTGSLANLRGGTSLIDDFKANGYRVGYISGQDDSFGSASLDVGGTRADYLYTARDEPHRRYTTFSTPGSLAVPFSVVEEKVQEFLQHVDDRPTFLYVNFHDTHFPYHHKGMAPLLNEVRVRQGDISPNRREQLRAMYLNSVANVDAAIGRVLAAVEARLGDDVGIVILSDHGESLYDEGFLGHGYALNEVQTRIPLIVNNLPMTIQEPWSQHLLRDALRDAMQNEITGAATPRRVPEPEAAVFQYLGGIQRPRQIGWRRTDGVVLLDVRNRRGSTDGVRWIPLSDIMWTDEAGFHSLLTFWDRMRLAVQEQRGHSSRER